MYKILKKEILSQDIEKMIIEAPYVARKCEPGQFVIVMVEEGGERIPLTIADYDRSENSVTIIYQIVGYTTKLLSQKQEGESISGIAGPMGQPAHMKNVKRVLGIGGGVGAAPLYPQIKKLAESGTQCDVIIGSRTEELMILQDEFGEVAQNMYFATNDGSKGKKGFVTDVLKDLIAKGEKYDEIIAIGPLVMMKSVVEYTKELNIPTSVSLNPIMIDGTGMCGGCRVTIGKETKFACVDGPDFDGFLVDFEELMRRQTMYHVEETEHRCRIGL
jgi:NAD(P)H-flavin reductase